MTKTQIYSIALQLLDRVNLTGVEVPAFVEVRNELLMLKAQNEQQKDTDNG